jgi:hypothetical protein
MVRIILRYFAGCPNWRLAEERLRAALATLGMSDAAIALEPVETPDEAVRLGFRGSPTILVDGRDPFADEDASVGLACRIYVTDEGPQGAPTIAQLQAALAA